MAKALTLAMLWLATASQTAFADDAPPIPDDVAVVSDLPDDLRYDSLVIHGEDSTGKTEMQMYVIERDVNGKRIWVKQNEDWTRVESRFEHMFVLPGIMKQALPMAKTLGLSESAAEKYAKKAALAILSKVMQEACESSGHDDE